MRTQLLYEEINRIKLLFGENLLYGNLNNDELILEQYGRFFKKVWDDFKINNPTRARSFDDLSITRFTDTDIKSLDNVFRHVEDNKAIWKAIGLTEQEIARVKLFKKKIVEEDMPDILFRETSTPGIYFFDLIPITGGLRGEVFYWFSKKYPDEWLEGLTNVQKNLEVKNKIDNLKDLKGEKVDIEGKSNLPVKRSEVRVDSEGRCLDFNSKGEAIDVEGKLIEFDVSTGKPKGDFLPKVDDGGKINLEPDPDPPTFDVPGVRRFIGNMEGRNWSERVQRAAAENYFGYWIDRLMPKVSELYKQLFGNKNYEAARLKFNDLVFNELNNELKNYAVTAPGNIQRIRGNINDAFIDFYRTLENDPDFNNLNFDGVWGKMMDEFESSVGGLTPVEIGKCKTWFEKIKTQIEADLLAGDLIKPSGRPNIAEYSERIGLSEKGWLARSTDKFVLFYKQCVIDLLPWSKKDKWWANLYNVLVTAFQTVIRPAWNIFIRGTLMNPKAMKLFLGTESRILGFTLRPFSKEKYAALILRNLVLTKFVFPFIQATYLAAVQFAQKGYEIETGREGSIEKKGVGFWDIYGRNLANEFIEEFKGASEGDTMDLIVQWFPGYWDDALLIMSGWEEEDASGQGVTFEQQLENLKKNTKDKADSLGINSDIVKNGQEIATAEFDRQLEAKKQLETFQYALRVWVKDEGREDLEPYAIKIEKSLKMNNHIIRSMADVNSETKHYSPQFELDGKKYYVIKRTTEPPLIRSDKDGSEQSLIDFIEYKKDKINKLKESIIYNKNIIMENSGKKFGEDNFKHWNDTFIFKTEDKKNPGQFKEVKISMEDVMDRIDHYRKKYDEDDAFVRAVVDTHEDVVKIMYTKGLADIHESFTPRGLALLLRTLNESRGEMEIFSVARPANGNWFLVKGDFTQSQLANMDLEKKEPEDKKKEKEVSGSEELKKKEETAINILTTNEKKGLDGLPKKVRQKVLEKMGRGWTTEILPEFLKDIATKSEINTIFNDKIEIYKLEPTRKTFDSIVDNSSRIFIKRGFCRSLYLAADNADLTEKQENVIDHILDKCDTKFAGKLGVRNF